MTQKPAGTEIKNASLGTFAGVFTPSVLTILGIILFLRLGYVVGSAGLGKALLIIAIANTITVLTSFSLSAIATNLRVKGGGDYYLISRTLGLEFGGALGVVLFLAQAVSIAFYAIGFGEALTAILPPAYALPSQICATAAVLLLFFFAWLGSDWASRFQYMVMGMLIIALLSFFAGGFEKWDSSLIPRNWLAPADGSGFWLLFAIFFPAVTGFTQGVSMSGDLKDPAKSLPVGTFIAVGISIAVYFAVAVLFAGTLTNQTMMNDYGAMKLVARYPWAVDMGVIAATLSSAMASFMGAPRILQSLAKDQIFPFLHPFAKGAGATDNPRRGVLLSLAIALLTISLGNLNLIAAIVSMFFLISYGLLNYATYYEAKSESPSFRPRFRWYHRNLSLAGWIVCLVVILAIDMKNGIIAVAIITAIRQYLKRTATTNRWADSRQAYYFQQIRNNLIAAAKEPPHPRSWRPHLLTFCEEQSNRTEMLHFSSWIVGRSGTATAVQIVEGEGVAARRQKAAAEEALQETINTLNDPIFPLVVAAPDMEVGIYTLVQSFGIGPLKANTMLLNWFERMPTALESWKEHRYGRILHTGFHLGFNTIVFSGRNFGRMPGDPKGGDQYSIDVWWWGDASSRLMLLLAYLMTRHDQWKDATIRIIAANYQSDGDTEQNELTDIASEARIDAACEIIPDADIDRLAARSEDAALVFAPLRFKKSRLIDPFGGELKDLIVRVQNLALVMAAEDIDLDAAPEEGEVGDMADALDTLNAAQEKERKAIKLAEKTAHAAEEEQRKLAAMKEAPPDDAAEEAIARQAKAVEHAEEKAEEATRKFAKAKVKAETAAKEAAEQGVDTEKIK